MKRKPIPVAVIVVACPVLAVVAAVLWLGRTPPPAPIPPGPNAVAFVDALFSPSTDFATRRQRLHEIRSFTHYTYPGGEAGYMEAVRGAAGSPGAATPGGGTPPSGTTGSGSPGGAAAGDRPSGEINMLALQIGAKAVAAFPSGLPEDLFSTVSGRRLIAVEGRPVRVLSVGPDRQRSIDSSTGAPVAYDPTNGIASPGDLFIEIAPNQGRKE